MKPLREWVTDFLAFGLVTFVIGSLVYLATSQERGGRVERGSPEYEAFIEEGISRCVQGRMNADRRTERWFLPSRAEYEAHCRTTVLKRDRLYPEARPRLQSGRRGSSRDP
jgi:hypothetical protein